MTFNDFGVNGFIWFYGHIKLTVTVNYCCICKWATEYNMISYRNQNETFIISVLSHTSYPSEAQLQSHNVQENKSISKNQDKHQPCVLLTLRSVSCVLTHRFMNEFIHLNWTEYTSITNHLNSTETDREREKQQRQHNNSFSSWCHSFNMFQSFLVADKWIMRQTCIYKPNIKHL